MANSKQTRTATPAQIARVTTEIAALTVEIEAGRKARERRAEKCRDGYRLGVPVVAMAEAARQTESGMRKTIFPPNGVMPRPDKGDA